MKKRIIQVIFIITGALIFLPGCGEKQNPFNNSNIMKLKECNLEVDIPSGWKLDASDMCSKGDFTGLFFSEPLDGRTFEKAVDEMSTEFNSKIISKTELKVASRKAFRVYIDPNTGMKVIRLYIDCGDKIAYLSYAVSADEFASYEPDLLKSIDSIRQK